MAEPNHSWTVTPRARAHDTGELRDQSGNAKATRRGPPPMVSAMY